VRGDATGKCTGERRRQHTNGRHARLPGVALATARANRHWHDDHHSRSLGGVLVTEDGVAGATIQPLDVGGAEVGACSSNGAIINDTQQQT